MKRKVCPRCGYPGKDRHQQRAGQVSNPRKGFGTPEVLAAALAIRRRNQLHRRNAQTDDKRRIETTQKPICEHGACRFEGGISENRT